jgi:phosphatidate cytidylyltransferase
VTKVMSSDLRARLRVAVLGIPTGFFVVWAGGWVLGIVLAVIAVIGTREALRLGEVKGSRPFLPISLVLAAGSVILAPVHGIPDGSWAGWVFGAFLGAFFLALGIAVFRRAPTEQPLASVALTVAAPLYAAVPLAFAWFLRHHPAALWTTAGWAGTGLLLLPVISTWMGDTTAYFGGRAFGRRKLLPRVSPAKTVEGSLWGLAGSMGASVLLATVLFPVLGGGEVLSLGVALFLGLVIGMVAQVGDLAESVLKREAGVKDSGHILPGHGGVLDRFDALLFTLPLTWWLLFLFFGEGVR